jgi:hypothetical protein
MCTLVIAEF